MTRFWYTWAVVIYRGLVSLIGIPGNILILAVYWDKQALGSAQVFIQTLALSDLYGGERSCEWYDLLQTRYGGSGIALLVTIPQYLSCLAAFIFIVILYVKLWIVVARQRRKIGTKEVKYDDDTSVVGDKMSQAGSTKTNVVEYSVTNVQYTANDTAVGGKGTEADTRLETSGKSTERDSTETEVSGADDRLNGHNDSKLQKAEDSEVRISSRPALQDSIATGGSREENNKVTKSGDQLHPTNAKQPRSLTFANKVRPLHVKCRRGQSHKVVSRLTLMLLLATAIFFFTWFVTLATFALTPLTRPFFGNNIAYVMIALLRLSGLINHSINPLLYSFLNPKFRADCRTLFKRLKSRL
ncbi:putative muscarinic acetylcholine receptor M1-like [Apostichopus japonicus]|uniref:Putative muscarinic acetylcholine receptor M1-like n=1 Tax=Stichopus japonicus TaxID=307972 RepID=A0A2G8L7N1_STIJA|nr:putative muscarinic acetylcholine receptor M1-like [Apostichopus japonicus]